MSKADRKKAAPENKNNKIAIILIAVLAVVVLALVAVIAFMLGKKDAQNDASGESSQPGELREVADSTVRTVMDEESAGSGSVADQMREQVEEGMFECQMAMTWNFPDGQSESTDAYVANNVNNTHPICFDVYMKDTDELLYSSPVLPVGTDLKNIKLDKELPAGEYKAVVMYKLLKDAESQKEISTAGFVVKINVLN
jgi:hypothetical protein